MKMSGLACSHTHRLEVHTLSSWIVVISKPPSCLHILPQDTKPWGMTVPEIATALLLILSQH